MTSIDSLALSDLLNARSSADRSSVSVNQSAWKKELESQLYDQEKQQLSTANDMADTLVANQQKKSQITSIIIDGVVEAEPLSASAFANQSIVSSANGIAGDIHQNMVNIKAKTSVQTPLNVSSNIANQVPVSSMSLNNTAVIASSTSTLALPITSSFVSTAIAHGNNSFEIKPVHVQLLADGELIIRDYKSANLSHAQLEGIVSELKNIVDKDVQRLRINGNVVWESNKHLNNDNYVIDLVY